jgi:hypothetical protein
MVVAGAERELQRERRERRKTQRSTDADMRRAAAAEQLEKLGRNWGETWDMRRQ